MRVWSPSRTGLIIGAASFACSAIAVALSIVWWWVVADGVRASVAAWVDGARARGWVVSGSPIRISGWPFRAKLRVDGPSIVAPDFRWTGETIKGEVSLFSSVPPKVILSGPQSLVVRDDKTLAASSGEAKIIMEGGVLRRIEGRLAGVVATLGAGVSASIERLDASAEIPDKEPVGFDDPGLTIVAAASSLVPAGDIPEAFRPGPRTVDARLRVKGRPPFPDRERVEAWSRDGGVIEIDRAAVDWGPSSAIVEGTMTFDKDVQPVGAGTVTIRGADAAVDAFAARLRPKAAAAARMAVGMLAHPGADGESEVKLPITIQDRALFLGPARVAKLPPVAW